jgi:phosphatidylglycerophosphatase A
MKGDARKWIVTFGGAGMLPGAPGTAGSFATALLLYVIGRAVQDALPLNVIIAACAIVSGAATIALGAWAIEFYGREDPGPVVLDEVAGICLTMLWQPSAVGRRAPIVIAAAFLMFRIFDILKPPPCRRLEKLPAGWGILMDDLMAGVYANVACQILLRWLLPMI